MKLNTQSLKDVSIGMPVLTEGTYFAKIDPSKVTTKPQKSGGGLNLLVPVTILGDELVTFDGKKIQNRGQVKLTRYISLVKTDDYDPDSALKELAVACHVPEDKEDFETSDIQGFIKVKLVYNKPQGQYDHSNSIARFYPIKETDNFVEPSF